MNDAGYDNTRKWSPLFISRIGAEDYWQVSSHNPICFAAVTLRDHLYEQGDDLIRVLFLFLGSLLKMQIKMSIDAIQVFLIFLIRCCETINLLPWLCGKLLLMQACCLWISVYE